MLHRRGTTVYLISGGFRSIIEPVAKEVDIPSKNIFANRLSFYFNGRITHTMVLDLKHAHAPLFNCTLCTYGLNTLFKNTQKNSVDPDQLASSEAI